MIPPPPPDWNLIGSQCSMVPPLHSVGNDRSSLVTPPPPHKPSASSPPPTQNPPPPPPPHKTLRLLPPVINNVDENLIGLPDSINPDNHVTLRAPHATIFDTRLATHKTRLLGHVGSTAILVKTP